MVFYRNIIDRILDGEKHKYSEQHLNALYRWAKNDERSMAKINEERFSIVIDNKNDI